MRVRPRNARAVFLPYGPHYRTGGCDGRCPGVNESVNNAGATCAGSGFDEVLFVGGDREHSGERRTARLS
jgi:hypothetical protein